MTRPRETATASHTGFRSFYGDGPLHLIGLLLALALTAYTLSVIGLSALWNTEVWWQSILVWFLGAVIAHDLIVFPLYAAGDRVLHRVTRSTRGAEDARRATPPRPNAPSGPGSERGPRPMALNYLRVPIIGVALLFVLFFPGIFQQGADTYLRATGQTQDPFLGRFLALSAVIFVAAATAYAARLIALRRAATSPSPDAAPDEEEAP